MRPASTVRFQAARAPRRASWGCLLLLCWALPACQAPSQGFAPREGDLLFQDSDGGPLCDAIEAVTFGCEGAKFSHVGIAATEHGEPAVIEASGKVKITPLKDFLARSKDARGRPKVVVGRLQAPLDRQIPSAIARARALIGQPYDDVFRIGNGKYYCSELVYEVFRDEAGRPVFELAPMTFCPPGSSQPLLTWKDYFARKGEAIPEGQPGCNPGGLSRSEKITVVYAFGRPTGWSEDSYRRYATAGRN